ncbi:hypothetical protein DFJ74DRAFT_312275 [Hyaloraphidium curvatum]|nr:hypothetical protein DFJ74DRAFT_312275 [Hyaloraphidium curvatum]
MGNASSAMEECVVVLSVMLQEPDIPPVLERKLTLPADALERASASSSALLDLPAVRAFKHEAVDSRRWKCFVCGTRAVDVPMAASLDPAPASRIWPHRITAVGMARCASDLCNNAVVSTIREMEKKDVRERKKPSVSTSEATFELAKVSVWSDSGAACTLSRQLDVFQFGTTTMTPKSHALSSVQSEIWILRTHGIRDWPCFSCGRKACSYYLAVTEAPPRPDLKERWIADIFPHCDSPARRATASAEAKRRAGNDPKGFAEGSFCAVCFSSSTDRGRGMQRCGRCQSVKYCSTECQKAHWPKHKASCVPGEDKGSCGFHS